MATVRVTLPHTHWVVSLGRVRWEPGVADYISLGSSLSPLNTEILLGRLQVPRDSAQEFGIELSRNYVPSIDAGPEFTNHMRNSGTLSFVASNGDSLVVQGIGDQFEPYYWHPTNTAEIYAFGDTLAGLTDRSLVATFTDNVAETPRFIDPSGDAIHWTTGVAITPLIAPEAIGTPLPTYTAEGTLPTGVTFNAATRTFSGTPTVVGAGVLTVRATNSEGTADWLISYAASAALVVASTLLLGARPIAKAYLGDVQQKALSRRQPATGHGGCGAGPVGVL